MRKKNRKPPCRKIVLRLPDLDQAKSGVLNRLSSPSSRRNYKFAMEQFIARYCNRVARSSARAGLAPTVDRRPPRRMRNSG